ncbi:hypothetical protein F5B18DRAFT_322712 [Nemania serpens]|nr:hypothetical protein F5B18DRAFT_322712 [Nemania serpens]
MPPDDPADILLLGCSDMRNILFTIRNKRLLLMFGCMKVKYCSRECQRTDWKAHKSVCKWVQLEGPVLPTEKSSLSGVVL